MKKVLITGAGSYIGTNVENWLNKYNEKHPGTYEVTVLDMIGDKWKEFDFHGFDSVYHVAGIAHADITNVSEECKKLYYHVNCNLAAEIAQISKDAGVKQFIYMSSLLVYGDCGTGSYKDKVVIKPDTTPHPSNFYGDSKWQAELKLEKIKSPDFNIAILRPPMIYGKGCKGNYNSLVKIALKTPVFPKGNNERSVLYIGNLCEFVRLLIESGDDGIFWPQNKEHVKTSDFVKLIAMAHHKNVRVSNGLNWAIEAGSHVPGKIGRLVNKAFGSLAVDEDMSKAFDGKYQIYSFKKSILETEK